MSLVDDADLGREVGSILDWEPTPDSAAATAATSDAAVAATPPPHALWPWAAAAQPPLPPQPQPPTTPPPPPCAPVAPAPGWSRRELQVCMLGTGCAVPSKHRAPAAIYLHLFARGGLLLDCGEGTLGQLHRLFGAAGVARVLARLRCVWISHLHADHHLGLARLLAAVAAARAAMPRETAPPPPPPPLLVVGPRGIGAFLDGYAAHVALRYQFRACHEFNGARCAERHWLLSEASGLGLAAAHCVPVTHCADAWGLVLTHRRGWRLAYSGDTRPCAALARAARGATLLIHEATFADDLAADALAKRHSTHGEAREVARQCGAYRTLLTHLSARYDARDAKGAGGGTADAKGGGDLKGGSVDAKGGGESGGADAPPSAAVGGGGGIGGEADAAQAVRGATHASAALLPALEALCDNADAVVATAADDATAASTPGAAAAGAPASVAVAFDLMVVNLADLAELPQCIPRLARFLRGAQQRRAREAEAQLEAQRARSRRLEAQAAERLQLRS